MALFNLLNAGCKIKYTLNTDGDYLLFTFSGKYNFNESIKLIHSVKSECITNKIFKVLIDNRLVDKILLSDLNRFNLGVEIGQVLNSKIQTAVLDDEDGYNHLVELSAINRSAFIKVSSDRKELLKWLA